MKVLSHVTFAIMCCLVMGCRTPAAPERADTPPIIEEVEQPEWVKRSEPCAATEIDLGDEAFAFDAFVVGAGVSLESVWLVIHPVLGWLANHARGGQAKFGYLALMNELDPMAQGYTSPTHLEVSYLLGKEIGREQLEEGISLRFWREVDERTPTLTMVLWYDREASRLGEVEIWTHPDVREGASSALITHDDALIMSGTLTRTELHDAFTTSTTSTTHSASLLPLLHGMLWQQLAGPAYMESPLRQESIEDVPSLHDGLRPELGLVQRDRELDEVLEDTQFLPDVDVDAIFTP